VHSALLAENEDLKRRLSLREAEVAALRESVAEEKRRREALQHRLDLLLRSVHGRKSETVVVGQGLLAFAGRPPSPPQAPPAAPARESDFATAHEALARYRLLYAVEREADDADRADGDAVGPAAKLRRRYHLRLEKAKPVLAEFEQWIEKLQPSMLPNSPIGQAVAYARNHWRALVRYADFAEVPIDNNLSERELRPVAVGRKNWLFAGSDGFGAHGAVLFGMTSACKANGVDPWAWMSDVLVRISTTPPSRFSSLLPGEWARERGITPKK
jgi:hypothetical protein